MTDYIDFTLPTGRFKENTVDNILFEELIFLDYPVSSFFCAKKQLPFITILFVMSSSPDRIVWNKFFWQFKVSFQKVNWTG